VDLVERAMNDLDRLKGLHTTAWIMLIAVATALALQSFWYTFVVLCVQAFVWALVLQGVREDLKAARPLVVEFTRKGDRMK
jgi:hypothetical protein